MKHRFWLAGLVLCTSALADPQIPDKLVGIWTTDGSTLQGERLISGRGLYIDVDGVGAMVSVNGTQTVNSRMAVTEFAESDHQLQVDATDRGQATRHLTLVYDETHATIMPADDAVTVYRRHKVQMSPTIRQTLGLEPAPLSIPPPVRHP